MPDFTLQSEESNDNSKVLVVKDEYEEKEAEQEQEITEASNGRREEGPRASSKVAIALLSYLNFSANHLSLPPQGNGDCKEEEKLSTANGSMFAYSPSERTLDLILSLIKHFGNTFFFLDGTKTFGEQTDVSTSSHALANASILLSCLTLLGKCIILIPKSATESYSEVIKQIQNQLERFVNYPLSLDQHCSGQLDLMRQVQVSSCQVLTSGSDLFYPTKKDQLTVFTNLLTEHIEKQRNTHFGTDRSARGVLFANMMQKFANEHTIPLWICQSVERKSLLVAEDIRERDTQANTQNEAEAESSKGTEEEKKEDLQEDFAFGELVQFVVQVLQHEMNNSVSMNIMLPSAFPFSNSQTLYLVSLLQKNLLSMAHKAIQRNSLIADDQTENSDTDVRKRVQRAKTKTEAKLSVQALLDYTTKLLNVSTAVIDISLYEKLANTRPESETKPSPDGNTATTSQKKCSTSFNEVIKSSFIGTILPTLIISLHEFTDDPAFASQLLPTVSALTLSVDKIGGLIPQVHASEEHFNNISLKLRPTLVYLLFAISIIRELNKFEGSHDNCQSLLQYPFSLPLPLSVPFESSLTVMKSLSGQFPPCIGCSILQRHWPF